VLHLLNRFFNNEMLSVGGGETLPLLMTIAGALAVPTLIVAIFVFPSYHAMPPRPPIPPFWNRTSEHLFYVVYSLVTMGVITVLEADMLFPHPLDVFVLSTLPIPYRRLVLARTCATLWFLAAFLFGVNSLGIFAYPIATEFHSGRLFLAQSVAVTAAGTFAAASFLAAQGVLICILSGRVYRVVSMALQGVSIAVLMTILFAFHTMYLLLPEMGSAAGGMLQYFPPYWFLGMYERILAGSAALPVFSILARTGAWATLAAVAIAMATYPLAYVRKTRQAIEGTAPQQAGDRWLRPLDWVLHRTILREPSRRAVYHFISQTIRTPRHRLYLTVYTGLGAALVIASTLVVRVQNDHLQVLYSAFGLQAAVPGVAFWAVSGLCSTLVSPADPRGGWVFRVIDGAPTPEQLGTVRLWVALRAAAVTIAAIALLCAVSPGAMRHASELVTMVVVGLGLCILLPDAMLLTSRAIPFTETRIPLNTDLAFTLLRYVVVLPAVVMWTVKCEPWMASRTSHLLVAIALIAATHAAFEWGRRDGIGPSRPDSIAELNGTIEPLSLRE
jgi:hypothetical protein